MKKKIIKILTTMLIIISMTSLTSFADGLPFIDVPTNSWYYNDIKNAYEMNLINGMTENTFEPDSNITYAQTVKLAVCMHQKYTMGMITLTNGSPNWWDSYVYYAKIFGIISKDYNWNDVITRAEYIEIFSKALPEDGFYEINNIPINSIPDVSMAHPQASSIYKMYRAGILTGVDETGLFQPNSNIKRSEVSAILTRMMNKNTRKNFTLGSNSSPTTSENDNSKFYIINFNSTGGSWVSEQKVKENERAVWPADPYKDGYKFAGWYVDSHLTKAYNFDTPVTSDITLYTKWIKK